MSLQLSQKPTYNIDKISVQIFGKNKDVIKVDNDKNVEVFNNNSTDKLLEINLSI